MTENGAERLPTASFPAPAGGGKGRDNAMGTRWRVPDSQFSLRRLACGCGRLASGRRVHMPVNRAGRARLQVLPSNWSPRLNGESKKADLRKGPPFIPGTVSQFSAHRAEFVGTIALDSAQMQRGSSALRHDAQALQRAVSIRICRMFSACVRRRIRARLRFGIPTSTAGPARWTPA